MARATSPSIPRSESKTPPKWPKCHPLAVKKPKMGQNTVNLEISRKCWKIIGKCLQPKGKQFRQSTHPNSWQGPSPRQYRDLSPKQPPNGPKCPSPRVNRPKMGQNPVNLELSPKCWKIIGKCPIPIGKQFRQSTHPNSWQGPPPRQSRDQSRKHPQNGPNAIPRL